MNYYEVLGVDKTASKENIKSAYRNLCKIHHPDKGGNEDKFKEISEAYDTLSDDEKRRNYDRFGKTGNQFGGQGFDMNDIFSHFGDIFGNRWGGNQRAQRKGGSLRVSLQVTLEEVINGTNKKVKYRREKPCQPCRGKGGETHKTCLGCNGLGHRNFSQQTPFGSITQTVVCNNCGGSGKIISNPCKSCNGTSTVIEDEIVEIQLPKGVATGMNLTMEGWGNHVRDGIPGDLHIVIEEIKHAKIKREGNDLHTEEWITIPEAVLGCMKTINTINESINIKIPSGCESGKIFSFAGKGTPILSANGRNFGNGSLFVKFNVRIPNNLSEKEKYLYTELSKM
jgi:molecular chaperone DnaJ